jgi:hypothetical protein
MPKRKASKPSPVRGSRTPSPRETSWTREDIKNLEKSRRLRRRRVEQDRKDRIADFKARQRAGPSSLRFFGPTGTGRTAPLKARRLQAFAATQPLQILAEGDSWFDYPVPFTGGGIITHLEELAPINALNLAHHGDPVQTIMGVHQRQRFTQSLTDGNMSFQAILFSGGGDDLVGDQFCLWLKDYAAGMPAAQSFDDPRLNDIFAVVEGGYRDLIAMRDQLAPGLPIFTHAYDFAVPSDQGVCGLGPWMKPSLDYRGFPLGQTQVLVVRELLIRFRAVLANLAGTTADFILVETQGTLDPLQDWANEIHPTRDGFTKIAQRFKDALSTRFPGVAPSPGTP